MGVNSAMMNRSTKRELIKLLLQFSETLPQIDFGADEQKNMALDILETVAGKCRQDFSKAVAAKYADTMQALSQIIQTTDWHCQSQDENIQCHTLCQEIILQLVENLRHEKEIKKDIVFLPYKASMWDSLESVWKAAYEDKEHCNAYVIPIPYADLNPDRSVAAWHCERDQYPKYVPTLDWREVDLEKWHPDIIFIHNPYDNYNYITSVESRYYAQNLKHCTNKLVYIPYFVLDEPCTEESVEHFVLTAGVLNADEVIVQSEAMRELYIRILTKKTEQTARTYWEKRISGAGSPKIEKVLTSKKEDFEMPEKWQKLVEGKKVILYNTSLSAMLQNSDKVCDKLRYVFDVFRNRDDVVLWWRPHPLMKSTFHSMRPQYEAEYLSLEKQYIEEGWGIYDDEYKQIVFRTYVLRITKVNAVKMKFYRSAPSFVDQTPNWNRKALSMKEMLGAQRVYVCMQTHDPSVRAAYNGWYKHNEDNTFLIKAGTGLVLPYDGLSISYNAYPNKID